MKAIILCCLSALVTSCASSPDRQSAHPADTTQQTQTPPPSQPAAPAAFKENLSMVGTAVVGVAQIDSCRYALTLELRTVLPSGTAANLAESGQTVVAYPDYATDAQGSISLENERNRRLYELRTRKVGDAVIGTITLRGDGRWYLVDTQIP